MRKLCVICRVVRVCSYVNPPEAERLVILKCAPYLKCKVLPSHRERAQLSTYVRHLLQMRYLQAACAELIHPERSFVLQRGAAWVEGVGEVIIQKAADSGHVDVWETTQTSGEVGGVVTCPEDAAKLRVEQVLHNHPATMTSYDF